MQILQGLDDQQQQLLGQMRVVQQCLLAQEELGWQRLQSPTLLGLISMHTS
jgi:hypothetical protein